MEHKLAGVVFVIEDDKSVRETMVMALEAYGYKIQAVESGEEGIQILFKSGCEPPACILLDLLLPGMSGHEFLHKLKNECTVQEMKDTPVIIVTASPPLLRGNIPEGIEVLEKPFVLDTLMNKVGSYCVRH